jgi:hypothetical protein
MERVIEEINMMVQGFRVQYGFMEERKEAEEEERNIE